MRQGVLFFFIFLCTSIVPVSQERPYSLPVSVCLSPDEVKLYSLINSYRKQKRLPPVPLSKSLTFVAQTHVRDLMEQRPDIGECNGHSWSAKGNWSSCCYTSDHQKKECMWDKPKELTGYTSPGFEIVYFSSAGAQPEQALTIWQKSKGHNPLLINSGIWKENSWHAIGIGIYKNYAAVWFGMEKDKEGIPGKCK